MSHGLVFPRALVARVRGLGLEIKTAESRRFRRVF